MIITIDEYIQQSLTDLKLHSIITFLTAKTFLNTNTIQSKYSEVEHSKASLIVT